MALMVGRIVDAACTLRKHWANAAGLKRCVSCSRRRTTWCELSARLGIVRLPVADA
jgi:hypothetical protein